jgi:hypothetical protein
MVLSGFSPLTPRPNQTLVTQPSISGPALVVQRGAAFETRQVATSGFTTLWRIGGSAGKVTCEPGRSHWQRAGRAAERVNSRRATVSLLKSGRNVIVPIAIVVVLVAVWVATPYPRGALQARIDHARQHYEVMRYGKPDSYHKEYVALLWGRYGVKVRHGGCVVSWGEDQYSNGYNSTSERLLRDKYGKDIFKECSALAKRQYQDNHQR